MGLTFRIRSTNWHFITRDCVLHQWRSQPKNLRGGKNLGGVKMFDFGRITLFCLEKRFSKHKMTILSKNLWGAMAPLAPPGYAYVLHVRASLRPPWYMRPFSVYMMSPKVVLIFRKLNENWTSAVASARTNMWAQARRQDFAERGHI